MELTDNEKLPEDAIYLQEAVAEFGHSREFFRNHCHTYYSLGRAYVSRREAEAAHNKFKTIYVRPPENGQS